MEKDYISRERLKKEIDLTLKKLKTFPTMTTQVMHMQIAFDTLASMVNDAPAADVAPVKHGKWEGEDPITNFVCSVCGSLEEYDTNYCPNCGARMDGDTDASKQ